MDDSLYMRRALQLAQLGVGQVSPNPMVGCVVVYEDEIIGEGWHQKYGEAHAEVNAINAIKDKTLLAKATAYITLEPCSHFGKTPPCTDLLIKHQIKRVVICNTDPFPKVNGNGILKLKAAGMLVETNLLANQGRELNKRFFTAVEKNRPYVVLKWAETADGFIADKNSKPMAISGELAQMHSHKWRTEEDAILVGSQTVINDNPKLTARNWQGRNPIRVLLDPGLKCSFDSSIFNQKTKTYVFNNVKNAIAKNTEYIKIDSSKEIVPFMLDELHKRSIQSLLVEGGSRLHKLFFDANIFDEVRVFKSKRTELKDGVEAASLPKKLLELENIDLITDKLRIYSKTFQPF